MAILEGGHIVPPRTQATSRSPAPLGLNHNEERSSSIKKKIDMESPLENALCKYITIKHRISPKSKKKNLAGVPLIKGFWDSFFKPLTSTYLHHQNLFTFI